MKLFWVVAGICLMIISTVKAQDDPNSDLVIEDITTIPNPESLRICCTDELVTASTAQLTVIETATDETVQITDFPPGEIDGKCALFNGSVDPTEGSNYVVILELLKDGPPGIDVVAFGNITFTMPDPNELPTCDSAYGVGDYKLVCGSGCENPKNVASIKDSKKKHKVIFHPDELPTNTTCFVLDKTLQGAEPLSLCRSLVITQNEPSRPTEDIPHFLCNEITDSGIMDNTTEVIGNTTLDYTTSKMTVTGTSTVTTGQFIQYWKQSENEDTYIFKSCDSTEFPFICHDEDPAVYKKYVEFTNVYFAIDSQGKTETQQSLFIDNGLANIATTDTTLETRWKHKTGILATVNYYAILNNVTSFNEPPPYTEATVKCGHSYEHCYSYFIDLEAQAYTVSIQPHNKSDPNTIISESITMKGKTENPRKQGINIDVIDLEWLHGSSSFNVSVCFNPTESEEDFSSYQLLIINRKSQWIKKTGHIQLQAKGNHCFSPTTLDYKTFNIADRIAVIVTKRGEDGFSVLASGQTNVYFIMPDVDYSTAAGTTRVTWNNPDNYSFTVSEDVRSSNVGLQSCEHCSYETLPQNVNDIQHHQVVVETVDSPTKLISRITFSKDTADDVVNVIINQVIWPMTETSGFQFCWNTSSGFTDTKFKSADMTVIKIAPEPVSETSMDASDVTANCAIFDTNPQLETNDEADFQLRLYQDDSKVQAGRGSAKFTIPDLSALPVCDSASKVGQLEADTILRLHCSPNITEDNILIVDNQILSAKDKTEEAPIMFFYIQVSPTNTFENLNVCQNIDAVINDGPSEKLPACSKSIPIQDVTETETTISKATLEYEGMQLTVEVTVGAGADTFDVVNYWNSEEENISVVCPGLPLTNDALQCQATTYEKGYRTINTLLVGYKNGNNTVMLESKTQNFQDYDLVATPIFKTTIEMHWVLPSGNDDVTFSTTITNEEGGAITGNISFTSADVTCTPGDTGCYAYFIDIPPTTPKCKTTLQRKDNPTFEIVSEVITMPTPSSDQTVLEINKVDLEWQIESSFLNASVCFLQNDDHDLSSYQLLFVNQKGQWRREDGQPLNHQTGLLCFPFVTLDTQAFDINNKVTVTVMKRSDDGRQVLASGQISVNFPTLNALRRTVEITRLTRGLPEEGTFLLRQDSTTTSKITCKQCFYDVNAKDTGKVTGDQLLTMEILDSPINITLKITSN